jgi:hypothetical protein
MPEVRVDWYSDEILDLVRRETNARALRVVEAIAERAKVNTLLLPPLAPRL